MISSVAMVGSAVCTNGLVQDRARVLPIRLGTRLRRSTFRVKCANPNATRDLEGQTVLVIGLASSGRAAARLAIARGATVIGVDSNVDALPLEDDPHLAHVKPDRLRTELGQHARATFMQADLMVLSPGVPLTQVDVAAARLAGVPAISELAFAAHALPQTLPVAAITGTNGAFSKRLAVLASS
ncbi:hypothetical protein CYMTET_29900 [Cymbomonas tetramitiformis]|uniref:UDP-N-acetylmuramoyl-L-alanine--D-glutamate ligase n=1 Tax=Cymbomonas tetramitiformis TaxID=36881 RepID=A0AAE0FKH8_9CHLO|nr:hypothetical protein CYMTET_29900 [Cymbomonas tetramitiformis]